MSRFFLVVLAEDLAAHYQTRSGALRVIANVPGVKSITDLEAISQATLDTLLLKPTPLLQQEDPSVFNAVRRYHQRQRQPRLGL